MVWIALACAALLLVTLVAFVRARRRTSVGDVRSMRGTLEQRLRKGAELRF